MWPSPRETRTTASQGRVLDEALANREREGDHLCISRSFPSFLTDVTPLVPMFAIPAHSFELPHLSGRRGHSGIARLGSALSGQVPNDQTEKPTSGGDALR